MLFLILKMVLLQVENPQVEVKEVDVPELNPKIMAHKIAAMLQRGMHFRRVAYTSLRRIMGAGAQGVEVTISGKIRGSRSACAKFTDGYIKKCGEPSIKHVREGFATVQLKPGVLGIYVRIMPPNIVLPDKVEIKQVEISEPAVEEVVENIETEEAVAVKESEIKEESEGPVEILEEITEEAPEDAEEIPEEVPEEEVEESSEEVAETAEETPKESSESETAESEPEASESDEKAEKSE